MSDANNPVVEAIEEEALRRAKSRNISPLLHLVPFLTAYKGMLGAAFVALLLATLSTLVFPFFAGRVLDEGFLNENSALINQYFGTLVFVAVLVGLFSATRFYFVSWIGERVVADLRSAVYAHVLTLSPAFFEITRTSEVISRLVADTTLIKTVVGSSASIALRNLFLFFGAVIMMIWTSLELSVLVLLIIPVIVLPLIFFGRWVRKLSRISQDRVADTSVAGNESLGAIQTVQAFTREEAECSRFRETVVRSFEAARARVGARAVLTALVMSIGLSGIMGTLWVGAHSVQSGHMSGGELAQFVLYALFAAGSMAALSDVWGEVQMAAGATERLVELLEEQPDIQAPAQPASLPTPPRGSLSFEEVTFSYPARQGVRALDGFSLQVEPGETVAIVGPSGAGKSTLFQLLLRFHDPQSGVIRMDDVALATADPQALRKRYGVVPQEPVVFGLSAAENIRYGRPDATDEEVRQAARAAHIDAFLAGLPEGYATQFGERGVTLSGGQRQRIALARAVLRDAPILLLDEATSALDAESEQIIQKTLEVLMRGRTTLVIAHRLATVRKADRIVVMDKGKVVATGPHDMLIKQDGLYARLAALQFGDFADARTRSDRMASVPLS